MDKSKHRVSSYNKRDYVSGRLRTPGLLKSKKVELGGQCGVFPEYTSAKPVIYDRLYILEFCLHFPEYFFFRLVRVNNHDIVSIVENLFINTSNIR